MIFTDNMYYSTAYKVLAQHIIQAKTATEANVFMKVVKTKICNSHLPTIGSEFVN